MVTALAMTLKVQAALVLFINVYRVQFSNNSFPAPATISIDVNCPRFLNINTSRSLFETTSVVTKVIALSDPEKYIRIMHTRDISYFRSFWDLKDRTKSGVLGRNEAMDVLRQATNAHWKNEIAGLSEKERNYFLNAFLDMTGEDEVSFDNLMNTLKVNSSRCYFSGR